MRILVGLVCSVGLVLVFLFQQWDIGALVGVKDSLARFLTNKSIRFVLNDTMTIGLIYSLFNNRRYTLFSIYVQVFGVVFILLPYFLIKVKFPGYNGPLVNFIHRLVLNPLLLLLLIPAFYYQKKRDTTSEG